MPMILDTLYTRSPSRLSQMIAWATRGHSEAPTLATHQGTFLDEDTVVHAIAGKGVIAEPWADVLKRMIDTHTEWCITSHKWYRTRYQEDLGAKVLKESIGWRYSMLELPLQLLDGLIHKATKNPRAGWDVVVFRKLGRLWEHGVVCSSTSNRVFAKLGWRPPQSLYWSPDDSLDWDLHSRDWEISQHSKRFFRC